MSNKFPLIPMKKQATVIQRNHQPIASSATIAPGQVRGEVEVDGPLKKAMKRRASGVSAVQQQFFSPFRIRPSLETPTKRVDLNEWFRYYFKHDPYVGTAVELHATYPLCDFEVDHEDEALKKEFNEVKENLNMVDFLRKMGMEYWIVGEAFPFGFLDDPSDPSQWERFILLDPDKVKINKHPMAVGKHNRDYFIRLEPDADLKKIVDHGPNHPNTGPLYRNIPADVIAAVKKGVSIPLHPLQASHFKREVNAFNVRGESIISKVLQDLMYLDKLRDAQYAIADRHVCYDKDTECLTKDGWKKYDELGWNDLIGTVNKDTGVLEWQRPEGFYINQYKGPMHHFGGSDKDKKIDIMVTPDHRMLVQELKYQGSKGYRPDLGRSLGKYGYDGEWKVVKSQDVRPKSKFRACVDDFKADHCPEFIEIGDERYAIDDYLKMAGWYLSEGHWQKISDNAFEVSTSQTVGSKHCDDFNELFDKCGFRKSINNQGCVIRSKSGKEFATHFALHFGVRSWDKNIPVWIKNLPKEKLRILLDAMSAGDGHTSTESAYKDKVYQRKYVQYYSVSKQLADDVQEIVFKLGFVPTMHTDPHLKKKSKLIGHTVQWSETSDAGKFPIVGRTKKDVSKQVDYDDVIWCVMVPNTFFVTRRNGKIAVQGNTPKEFYMIGEPGDPADEAELADFENILQQTYFSPNTAVIYHHALKVQWEGASGRILPLKPEFDLIEKRLLAGLMMSSAFLHGEGPCLREDHEILTESGWMPIADVPDNTRLMTYNKETGASELQHFKNRIVQDFEGDLLHFNTNKIDCVVTPNHRMLVKQRNSRFKDGVPSMTAKAEGKCVICGTEIEYIGKGRPKVVCSRECSLQRRIRCNDSREDYYGEWEVVRADQVAKRSKLPVKADWSGDGAVPMSVDIGKHQVGIREYLRFAGWYASEGYVSNGKLGVSQANHQSWIDQFCDDIESFDDRFGQYAQKLASGGTSTVYITKVSQKEIADHFANNWGVGSRGKKIPQWVKDLPPTLLTELVDTLVLGDGSIRSVRKQQVDDDRKYISYHTISKQLADDVQEVVWKCGRAPIVSNHQDPKHGGKKYVVSWSESDRHGLYPNLESKKGDEVIKKIPHNGKVYCYEVPNEFLVVRRNGKILIVGNTYANATVALDVLIARYMEYRKRLEHWTINHVFDPICRMNSIYKPTDAELKHRIRVKRKKQPWVPKMQWERGSMRDDQFKTNLIKELVQGGLLPREDLYRIINKRSVQVEQELQDQAQRDKEKQKKGIPIPGQPQMAGGGGAGGLPAPPPGGGAPPPGAGAGLPKGGLPPGAPKIPGAPGGGLPMGSPVPNASGTGPSEGPGGML